MVEQHTDDTQWDLFLKINNHRNTLLESKKLRLKVPSDIKKIYNLFKKNRKQLFIVGGAVRDAILGKSPKDFDLATDAKPDEVLAIAKKGGFKSLELGKAFGVVVIGGHEIATFRKDIGKGRRPDAVDYTNIEGDVKRRDLTINALFYDIGRQEIVDLVGGIKDLKKKQIRTVGTAEERFDEDPLRKLRALRFTASIGGRVHPDTLMALKKDPSLKGVSSERIRDEFIKSIKKAKTPSKYLRLAQALGMLSQILPGLNINKNFINSNDYIVQVAYLLKDNKPSKLPSKLNSLRYTHKEVNNISFLVSLQNFDGKQIYLYKKMQEKATLSLQQIKNFGIFIGKEKELIKMFNFKLSVSVKDVPDDLKGKQIGDKIKDLEKDKFLNEAFAVRGSKVAKFITGHNLTMKGKKYKEIEFETLSVDNSSKMIKLKIIAPKNLFGMETPVKFSTLRRGPFTKTDTKKKIKEIAVRKKPKKFKDIYNALPIDLKKRVYNLKNYDQRRDAHPEGNVLKHTIAVTNRALRTGDIDFALAALFHDIGKDSTAKIHPKKGFWTHHGHEHVSAKLVLKYKKWIKSQGGNVLDIYYIVKQHMRMKVFDKMKWTKQKKLSQFRAFPKLKKFATTMDKGGRGINDSIQVEGFELPLEIGDTVLMGKFKNKKVVIKTIQMNDKGDLEINGKSASKFRILNKIKESTSVGGGFSADAGEPDTMFIRKGEKRELGTLTGKPELWFDNGGYKQVDFPVADDIFGKKGGGEQYTANYKVTDLGATEDYDYSYEESEGYIELDTLKESLLQERIDYLDISTEIVKAYNLKSKVKFATGSTLAEYVPETDTIYLRRSYPSVKEFLITILHEIKHALDAKQLGVKKFMKKYTQAGTMATYKGLDPHDNNKWEERAEKWAKYEFKRIKNKFNL